LRLLISVILMAIPSDARLAEPKHPRALLRKADGPSAHVFVINLDERTDKCGCMSQQLLKSPYPVTRFPAVTGTTLGEHCPNFWNNRLGGHSANNTMALTCSNVMVWEAAVKLADAEFVIILEDDTILTDDAWAKMEEVMRGGCTEWDYIMVDSWHGNPHKPMPEFACSPRVDLQMYNLTVGYGGSHFQIWRREALRPAIRQMRAEGYANPMDKVVHGLVTHSHRVHFLRAAAGFFNVSFQAGKRWFDPARVPEKCRAETILKDDRPVEVVDGQVVDSQVVDSQVVDTTMVEAPLAVQASFYEGAFKCPPSVAR